MAQDVTYAYAADITKAERDAEGNLMVYGTATDSTLDLDEQVADPEWLKQAMPEWARWGNLREMHQPIVAGVGKSLEEGENGQWMLKSEVVDAGTAKKIESGALKGYSIGIKNARVVKDKAAPGGRIVGGTIVEVSYVDRPCNPTATLMVAKAVGAENHTLEAVEKVTPATMARMLGKNGVQKHTKPGTNDAACDAKGNVGSTDDADAEAKKPRKHVDDGKPSPKKNKKGKPVEQADDHGDVADKAAKPATDDCPLCKGTGQFKAKSTKAADPDDLKARIASLEKRVQASGRNVDSGGRDVSDLDAADFAGPDGTFPIKTRDDVSDAASLAHHAADPAAVRSKIKAIARRKFGMKGSDFPPSLRKEKSVKSDKSKAAAADIEKAVSTATAALQAELDTLKAKPMPGGPVVVKMQPSVSAAEEKAVKTEQAARYREMAKTASDRELAQGYEDLAKKVEADLAK